MNLRIGLKTMSAHELFFIVYLKNGIIKFQEKVQTTDNNGITFAIVYF